MRLRYLHDGWTVTDGQLRAPATVPGCVHTDLLAAGLIDDPYVGDNESRLGWIGRRTWCYETTFTWHADEFERTDLVCEGLDTVATITLNGVPVAATANMHRSYHFPVRELLREGDNRLTVEFASPYDYAEANRSVMGARPGPYPEPYQFIRKMACNFGWDWGPTLVTSGIWRPIGLQSWSTARLAEVRPHVRRDGVDVHVRVERLTDDPLVITIDVAGVSAELLLHEGVSEGTVPLHVDSPRLWWPRGYGDQPLYPLTVTLARTGETWRRDIGFRSVTLDTSPDEAGSAFTLRVNDVPVFVRGANWIPDDCFPSRVTRQRLAERLDQACAANINLLRVWGGGIYESEDFYQLADERGLLVLQDFLFACAAYPEDEPLAGEVEAEAREQIVRLMPHPSLVMWIGNNENFLGYFDWDWQSELDGKSWGARFYLDTLPGLVAALDPARPYWPGSPYSGEPDRHPNHQDHGTVHVWDVWNEKDYAHYADCRPRFVAEFGFQGPPAYATARRAVPGALVAEALPQKAIDGHGKLLRGLSAHLPTPAEFDDWHYLTQLNQARAVAFGIEHFRSLAPHCMGAIVWQLNDCWPVVSWAAIDGDGRRKPLWYALRRAFADRILTFGRSLTAVNDSAEPWHGQMRVTRLDLDGEPLAKDFFDLSVPPRGVASFTLPDALRRPADASRELLVAEAGPVRALRFFAEDRDVAFPPAEFDAVVERTDGGYLVTVNAHTVVRELALFPDRLDPDASVDDMMITLVPGETATFAVTSELQLDPAALIAHPVLRCVNERRAR